MLALGKVSVGVWAPFALLFMPSVTTALGKYFAECAMKNTAKFSLPTFFLPYTFCRV
jgi:hypothetical protein